jgi:hypothetical protein
MFGEVSSITDFACVLGIPTAAVSLIVPKDNVTCRSKGCTFQAIEGNNDYCPAIRGLGILLLAIGDVIFLVRSFCVSVTKADTSNVIARQQHVKLLVTFPAMMHFTFQQKAERLCLVPQICLTRQGRKNWRRHQNSIYIRGISSLAI